MNHFPSSVLRAYSPQREGFPLLYETEDSATPGKPCVQNDRKEGSGSCFSDVRTWIQDSSQNAVILRGAEGEVAESIRKGPSPSGEKEPLPEAEEEPETTFFPIRKQP